MKDKDTGHFMHELGKTLFPVCRSLTGDGVRETLNVLSANFPSPLKIEEVPSGTEAFDWTIPPEWNIREAWIADEFGNKVVDFNDNNLHVVGYSTPVDCRMSLAELQEHIYSLEGQPDAIPYVTSYYKKRWGFCLAHEQRLSLPEGEYHVFIDSELKEGSLTYGEWILPGKTTDEVFISTYVCHPSMANNELSGPLVATSIARWLGSEDRRYTYRLVFVPETIGAITYLSRHREALRENVTAGFNLSCIGDERSYSFVESRYGVSLADKVAENVLKTFDPSFRRYSFLSRGSDERQYCSPGVDLPLVTLCRSKFGEYPEYHTSLDDFERVVTPSGLQGGFQMVKNCIEALECNHIYETQCFGEPQMGRRDLRSTISSVGAQSSFASMMDLLAYCDGTNDLVDISNLIDCPVAELKPIVERLCDEGLLSVPQA